MGRYVLFDAIHVEVLKTCTAFPPFLGQLASCVFQLYRPCWYSIIYCQSPQTLFAPPSQTPAIINKEMARTARGGDIRCGLQIYIKAGEELVENAEYIRQLMHLLTLRGHSGTPIVSCLLVASRFQRLEFETTMSSACLEPTDAFVSVLLPCIAGARGRHGIGRRFC